MELLDFFLTLLEWDNPQDKIACVCVCVFNTSEIANNLLNANQRKHFYNCKESLTHTLLERLQRFVAHGQIVGEFFFFFFSLRNCASSRGWNRWWNLLHVLQIRCCIAQYKAKYSNHFWFTFILEFLQYFTVHQHKSK